TPSVEHDRPPALDAGILRAAPCAALARNPAIGPNVPIVGGGLIFGTQGKMLGRGENISPGRSRPRQSGRNLLSSCSPGVNAGRRLVPRPARDGLLVAVVEKGAHVGLVEQTTTRHFEVG